MDLRFLALGAVLPDIVDTPIGLILWSTWQTPRLWTHSLLFGSVLMAVTLAVTRRGDRRKQWMLLATGVLMHLALDGMWTQPESLWWPFLGFEFTGTGLATVAEYVSQVVRDPWMWLGEVGGLGYLGYLWWRSGLNQAHQRAMLLATGRVSAPID